MGLLAVAAHPAARATEPKVSMVQWRIELCGDRTLSAAAALQCLFG
jgi:hypothetical protein